MTVLLSLYVHYEFFKNYIFLGNPKKDIVFILSQWIEWGRIFFLQHNVVDPRAKNVIYVKSFLEWF